MRQYYHIPRYLGSLSNKFNCSRKILESIQLLPQSLSTRNSRDVHITRLPFPLFPVTCCSKQGFHESISEQRPRSVHKSCMAHTQGRSPCSCLSLLHFIPSALNTFNQMS